MTTQRVTRGYGLLEGWLAGQRARMARRLLRGADATGAVLDVGCGQYPLFLMQCGFATRVGIDKHFSQNVKSACKRAGVTVMEGLTLGGDLPFADAAFSAVTMLAVFEHIPEVLLPACWC
jgi:2-polyprenyl-3-methyl-5-hydroxy-6-metoxy-1,4-benzoquinol methylase